MAAQKDAGGPSLRSRMTAKDKQLQEGVSALSPKMILDRGRMETQVPFGNDDKESGPSKSLLRDLAVISKTHEKPHPQA